jgi:hypothetical protein
MLRLNLIQMDFKRYNMPRDFIHVNNDHGFKPDYIRTLKMMILCASVSVSILVISLLICHFYGILR